MSFITRRSRANYVAKRKNNDKLGCTRTSVNDVAKRENKGKRG